MFAVSNITNGRETATHGRHACNACHFSLDIAVSVPPQGVLMYLTCR